MKHTDLRAVALDKIERQLAALECEYMIVPARGEPRKRGKFTHVKKTDRGARAAYVRQYLEDAKPGDTVAIPYAEYGSVDTTSSVTSACHKLFGKGNYVTRKNEEAECIEVLCLDIDPDLEEN